MEAMIPTATAAASEVVKTASGGSINAGIWTLVGVIVSTIGVVLVAYIKQWGPWRKLADDGREADFARLRDDIKALTARHVVLEKKVEAADAKASKASERAMQSDGKLKSALLACRLLLNLVEREMPDANEIVLVKDLLAQAATDDMGVGAGFRKIATMQGSGK